MRRFLSLALAVSFLFILAPGEARALTVESERVHPWCGTDGNFHKLVEAEATHRFFEKRNESLRQPRKGALAARSAPTARKEKNIVVIEDDGTLVAERNLFDFANESVVFKRKKDKLRALPSGAGIKQDLGDRVENADWGGCETIAPADDDTLPIDLPFSVKFYGQKYKRIFVNSDGNLTFEDPDCLSEERSLQRILNGPPRIAPFFGDLDPSVTSGEAGVFVNIRNTNIQVTWNRVPQFGTTNTNTFQVTVTRKGKITVAFGDIDAPGSIVGASPGRGTSAELVDFSDDLPVSPTRASILERYSLSNIVDDFGVAKVFFENFKDDYDIVILWLDFFASLGGAFAYEINLANDIEGIGLGNIDFSDLAGSDGRLESLVQMGPLGQYPNDPHLKFLGTNSTLDVLGQEAGHRWLAFVRLMQDGQMSEEILGRALAHWSFFMDSDSSDMEGNDIEDQGTGRFFSTVGATSRFSALDQYIMGLIPPEEVGPMFFVRNASGDGTNVTPASAPRIGVDFGGERVDFTVDDIIAFEGERVPSSEDAKKTFKMAFVLVAQQGRPASDESIDRLQTIAKEWVKYFKTATDGNGAVKTKIKKRKK